MNVPIKPQCQTMSFRYGDEQITFERVKRPQATGKVLIKVYPDCRVIVSVLQVNGPSNAKMGKNEATAGWDGFRYHELMAEFRTHDYT